MGRVQAVTHKRLLQYTESSYMGFPGGSAVKNPPVMQEMRVQFLGWEDPLEKEMYFCLGNPSRGAWRATVHGVAESQT